MRTLVVIAVVLIPLAGWAQGNLLPNGSFEEGAQGPAGWELSAEPGRWVSPGHIGDRCVGATGDGADSNYWSTADPGLEPGRTYEVSCWLRTEPGSGGGCMITGPSFANTDLGSVGEWTQRKFVFVTPSEKADWYVRFGQWHFAGTALYDDVAIVPAEPINRRRGALELGHGESLDGESYVFNSRLGGYAGGYSRPLHYLTAHFNSSRWVFYPGAQVVYRHDVGGAEQTAGSVEVTVGWHAAGSCIIQASTDGQRWIEVGAIGEKTTLGFDLPAELFPAREVFVRLSSPGEGERGDSEPGSFQVYQYSYHATLAQKLEAMEGTTSFLVITRTDPRLAAQVESLGGLVPGPDNEVRLRLRNPGAAALTVAARVELEPEDGAPATIERPVTVPAGGEAEVAVPYLADQVGPWEGRVYVLLGNESLFTGEFSFTVPELYRAGYGYSIASDDVMDLWWCEGAYKVNRDRPAPEREDPVVRLEAARGEFEPAQIVLRPKRDLTKLTAAPSDLLGPGGATIPGNQISVMSVGYVNVWRPTDRQGCEGWWPDPLPPLEDPIDLAANRNQPLWLRVWVPRDARPGDYTGTVALRADGWKADVPVALRVFDFEVPDRHSMVATMGFSAGSLKRYHHLQTDEQLRQVFDLYLRSFRDHRIDPYSPGLASVKVTLEGIEWNGGEVVADRPAEGQRCLQVADDSETANVASVQVKLVPVDREKAYVLRLQARTATDGQVFMVTLGSHDADGKWMSGRNMDSRLTGSTDWQSFEVKIPAGRITEGCRSLDLTLRATNWQDP
ncbi:MAG TPA: glycoside hydrolase domain-containing protein, partial [Armatimonadota bacterium]|nr:glycoside hydrolase domain-containing protein [Armatimonadota bacterium]